MTDAFAIETRPALVTVDDDTPAARVEVDVGNTLDRHVTVGVEVRAGEELDPAWVTVDPARFSLDVSESRRTGAEVRPPPDAPAGEYRFTLRAYDVDRPADAFATSPPVVVVVQRKEARQRPPWLLPVLGALVLVVAGVAAWQLLRGDDPEVAFPEGEQITGALGGDPFLEGGCVWVETDDGRRFEVLWPQGFRARADTVELVGPGGEVVARDGDRVTVTGEQADDVATICQVGPVFEATSVEVG